MSMMHSDYLVVYENIFPSSMQKVQHLTCSVQGLTFKAKQHGSLGGPALQGVYKFHAGT